MPIDSEDEVIIQEPLPRILMINFDDETSEVIKSKGLNVKVTTPRRKKPGDHSIGFSSPTPPHEIDILLVRDIKKDQIPVGVIIDWPSGKREILSQFADQIIARGGVCIFFVSENHADLLKNSAYGIVPDSSHKLWPISSAHSFARHDRFKVIVEFLKRWWKEPQVYLGLSDNSTGEYSIYSPLITDASGTSFVVFLKPYNNKEGFLLSLPDYGEKPEILCSLIEEVLPSYSPHLFPDLNDLSWFNDPEFKSKEVVALEKDKQKTSA